MRRHPLRHLEAGPANSSQSGGCNNARPGTRALSTLAGGLQAPASSYMLECAVGVRGHLQQLVYEQPPPQLPPSTGQVGSKHTAAAACHLRDCQ